MLEPPILFMVAPGCENVLGNFFPVPLMVAALGCIAVEALSTQVSLRT